MIGLKTKTEKPTEVKSLQVSQVVEERHTFFFLVFFFPSSSSEPEESESMSFLKRANMTVVVRVVWPFLMVSLETGDDVSPLSSSSSASSRLVSRAPVLRGIQQANQLSEYKTYPS